MEVKQRNRNSRQIPEVSYLLSEVEAKYGRRISTSADFESLSVVIEHSIGDLISSSTLKRLWGYVTLNPTPRIATLDVLARYVGYKNFRSFCESLKDSKAFVSDFFNADYLSVDDLKSGDLVTIGWMPNRKVVMKYNGSRTLEVVESHNSKLSEGDSFELNEIIIGYPMVISRILRNGEYTSSYIAGQQGGISYMKVNED